MKLKKILHIGKIICEIGVIGLGIAALCTPAAGVAIAALIVGSVAWGLGQAEDAVNDDNHQLGCDHPSLKTSDNKSKSELVPGDDSSDNFLAQIDNYIDTNSIVEPESMPISGDHWLIVDEV